MADQIVPFDFNGASVRVVQIDDAPWFVAKDICDILGISNNRDALEKLEEDEKTAVALTDGTPGNPNTAVVSESGMYTLVLRSRKPQAKTFRKWVTGTVLVSLRKTGRFEIAPTLPALPIERAAPPAMNLGEYARIIELMGWQRDPILAPLLSQRLAEELGSTVKQLPGNRLVLLSVRAGELGICAKDIGTGAALGKFIRNQGFASKGQVPHGRYSVHTYELSSDLDLAILQFFGQSKSISA